MTRPTDEKHWYALYVKNRAEKKTHERLTVKGITCYTPLYRKVQQWSDRRKVVELPFLPGYLFVRISPAEYDLVLKTENVVGYVRSEGKAAPIRDEEIEAMRRILAHREIESELCPRLLTPGQRIEIIAGPLAGIRAVFVKVQGKKFAGIRIEQLQSTIIFSVPLEQIATIAG